MEAAVLVICSPPGLALPIQMTLSIMSCRSPNKKNTVVHCGKCAQAQEPKRKGKGGLTALELPLPGDNRTEKMTGKCG